MPIERPGQPTVVIMARGDIFSQKLARAFSDIKWNVKQIAPVNHYQKCDLMIIKSSRNPEIIDQYTRKRIPVFIYDWGYFQRVNAPDQHKNGHWQLSHERLNTLPHWDLPPDRFAASGATLKMQSNNPDGYVLVCGQMPGDAAVAGTNHRQWLIDQCEHYRVRGFDVRYREHPRGGIKLDYPKAADNLMDAMQGACLVVTYNSNVGHDALLAGVPAVCDPSAPYAELSGEKLPRDDKRLNYFSRAAYGQWKYSEAAEAVDFVLNEWMPRCEQTKP